MCSVNDYQFARSMCRIELLFYAYFNAARVNTWEVRSPGMFSPLQGMRILATVTGVKQRQSEKAGDLFLSYFLPAMRQDERGKKCLGTLRALLLGSNMRGCSADEPIGSEIGRIFARRKLDVLALFETKLSGRGDSKLCVAWG